MSGETEDSVSGWTTDTLHAHMQSQLNELRRALDERHEAQLRAVDAAFSSQQRAVDAALAAAERTVKQRADQQDREFHEHLDQYRRETSLAFSTSDKAIEKAERAAEKRFDAVNEFRQQLGDQAATFMPRSEAQARWESLGEKLDALATRLDRSEGRGTGLNAGWVYLVAAIAAVGTIVSLYLALRGGG